MKIFSSAIHLVWLIVLVVLSLAPPIAASEFSSAPVLFAYDGQNPVRMAYDGGFLTVVDYDSAAVLSTTEEAHPTLGASSVLGKLSNFLAAEEVGQSTTVIGRMTDLDQFADNPAIDTWAKSGRIPDVGEPPVTWSENQAWLDARIARGDNFGIATDPATLPPVSGGYIPGQPNGYFTAREFQYLQQKGITIQPMH